MSCPTLTLRPATPADLPQILTIEETLFPGDAWPEEAFRRQIENSAAEVLALELVEPAGDTNHGDETPAKRLVGYVAVWLIEDLVHLMNIGVSPEMQGRGLGEYLMLRALQWARSHGAVECTLEVRVSNKQARSMYDRLGFRVEGRRRRYYMDNGEDAVDHDHSFAGVAAGATWFATAGSG